jgi:hypothetical protein
MLTKYWMLADETPAPLVLSSHALLLITSLHGYTTVFIWSLFLNNYSSSNIYTFAYISKVLIIFKVQIFFTKYIHFCSYLNSQIFIKIQVEHFNRQLKYSFVSFFFL